VGGDNHDQLVRKSAASDRSEAMTDSQNEREQLPPSVTKIWHHSQSSTICLATNATTIAKNINATRININIHVCSETQPLMNDCEPTVELLVTLTDRVTDGVVNGVLTLNGPVNVTAQPVSSLVCRTALTRTW